ncbi:MAG TPA: glycosyltransferase [Flavobacterium sp.]|uniref:glycosyltransferase n=1 Tax=Flavobacterium sp. TaxID=239 RepID=UPI002BB7BD92|nr:glycosyltransferase [Flavobacterium sp.]HNP32723.1 glycosyltransferase [Flavobacterium sp.]
MGEVKKNVLLLSTGDVNGAYEAIYRLAKLYDEEGHNVRMLVKNKTKSDSFIIQYKPIPENKYISSFKKIVKKQLKKRSKFDPNYHFISDDELSKNIDAAHLIKQIGFIPEFTFVGMTDRFMNSTDVLNVQQLTNTKVYTIAVDMNHFTGGCHYAWDCNGYINGCDKNCPAIIDSNGKNLAKLNFDTKFKNAKKGSFQIISMSQWTLNQAKNSKIYKDQTEFNNINSIIDVAQFNPNKRNIAKKVFDFDEEKFYILAGSQNLKSKRKGFLYFLEALKILEQNLTEEQKNKIIILNVSREKQDEFLGLTFERQNIDYINDYRLLSLLYQAVEVFVNPSIEDSGPMMVSEALACGTPVVGFDMGIVTNMVINNYNGYKASLKDSKDLAFGIQKILELSKSDYQSYSDNSFKSVLDNSSLDSIKKLNLLG